MRIAIPIPGKAETDYIFRSCDSQYLEQVLNTHAENGYRLVTLEFRNEGRDARYVMERTRVTHKIEKIEGPPK